MPLPKHTMFLCRRGCFLVGVLKAGFGGLVIEVGERWFGRLLFLVIILVGRRWCDVWDVEWSFIKFI